MRAIARFTACLSLFAVAAAAPAAARCQDPGMQQAFAAPGYLAPPVPVEVGDATFTMADGTQARLSDYRGKPVMLIFWATWCTGCHAELPDVDTMIKLYADQDIVFLPLALDTNKAQVDRYLASAGYEHIAANMDDGMQVFGDMCFVATPTHAVLDRQGRLSEVFVGAQPWSHPTARAYIQSLIDGTRG